MKIAVMQPYFFPYLGYFQLVHAVDSFVFFDDVNFIKKGWIHRNQVLQQNAAYLFSIPLTKASQNRKINEIEIADYEKWRTDFLKLIEHNYKKAPQYNVIHDWLSTFLLEKEFEGIGNLAMASVKETFNYLGLKKIFLSSSELPYKKEEGMNGQEKILSICKLLEADTYINPKNGVELYEKEDFESLGIDLKFIHMNSFDYPQFSKDTFVPYLSILDVLMFNTPDVVRELLHHYTLN